MICLPRELVPDLLLFGRPSGLISRRWTTFSPRSRSANDANRSALIFPTGRSRALTRAGAMASKGSRLILTRGDGPSSPLPGVCVGWGSVRGGWSCRAVPLAVWKLLLLSLQAHSLYFASPGRLGSECFAVVALPESGCRSSLSWDVVSWSLVGVKWCVRTCPWRATHLSCPKRGMCGSWQVASSVVLFNAPWAAG